MPRCREKCLSAVAFGSALVSLCGPGSPSAASQWKLRPCRLVDLQYRSIARGVLTPTRPTPEDVLRGECASGSIASVFEDHSLILQPGPFGSLWLRVVGDTLPGQVIRAASHWLEEYRKSSAAAFYVTIPETSPAVPDVVQWLLKNSFKFHHYHKEQDVGTADFVYYCWCGDPHDDKVPERATSIEGVSILLLSPDEKDLLLVWESNNWKSVSGALNSNEHMLEGGERELREEVGLQVDHSFSPVLVGGYSKAAARDLRINDNFHSLVMRSLEREIRVDGQEIEVAAWFPIEKLLTLESEGTGDMTFDSGFPGKDVIAKSTLKRLANFHHGRHMKLEVNSAVRLVSFY